MAILTILLTVLLVAISILIVLIVLLQRPKQEGLGAAFGGSTLDGALGAQTTDVLQKATTVFAIIFFVSAVALSMIKTRQFKNEGNEGVLDKVQNREDMVPPEMPAGLSPSDPVQIPGGGLLPGDPVQIPGGGLLPGDPVQIPGGSLLPDEGEGDAGGKGEAPVTEDPAASDKKDEEADSSAEETKPEPAPGAKGGKGDE